MRLIARFSSLPSMCLTIRVKSVYSDRQPNSDSRLKWLFHSSIIGIKNELTKQTVKILMRRLIRSHLDFPCLHTYVRIYLMSEFTRLYPTAMAYASNETGLPYCTKMNYSSIRSGP